MKTASTEEAQAMFSPAAPFFAGSPPKELRDEFAMAALIGLLAHHGDLGHQLVVSANRIADEMMKARNKETT